MEELVDHIWLELEGDESGLLECEMCGKRAKIGDIVGLCKGESWRSAKCECGSQAVGSPTHSDWCPRYEES